MLKEVLGYAVDHKIYGVRFEQDPSVQDRFKIVFNLGDSELTIRFLAEGNVHVFAQDISGIGGADVRIGEPEFTVGDPYPTP